ncbi:MAG: DNA primase [Ruminococcaceae bacterium]|nr:DNA primase [Oscillospiraceae bacterium]
MRLSEDFLSKVRESNDIYDVISSYVPLKKSGTDYVCNCPFHSEKTPSCHIYMATQSFYCFGCGAAGDVINFIRLYEHLDYMESIRFLAQRAGIPMPEDGGDEGTKIRARILEMNREAGKFYHQYLFSPQGKEGLDYLYSRGLSTHTIRIYGLGYAPNDWSLLTNHLNSLGFNDAEITDASLGVKSQRNNNTYDFFRYRVMFPFFDLRGNIVGFSGRVIGGDDTRKYLNTKATPVYNKSTYLYSMNHAKNSGKTNLIMCEGNLDVIAMHQAGFTNAVATCGTAITDSHARVIANQNFKEVTLAYDSDDAGKKATARAINILDKVGINAKILQIKGAKDPDEFIKKFGSDAFALQIDKASPAMEYELDKIKATSDITNPQGKADFLKKCVAFISTVHSSIDRAVYIADVSAYSDINRATIETAVAQAIKKQNNAREKEYRQEIVSGYPKKDKVNPEASKYPVEVQAERGIIAYLFHSPDFKKKICEKITPDDFPTEFNRRLFMELCILIDGGENTNLAVLGESHEPEEISAIAKIIRDGNDLPYSIDRLNDYINNLLKFRQKKSQKKFEDMSASELLAYANKMKDDK